LIEIDGPPASCFHDGFGNRYDYDVYAFMADTPKECMDAYFNWYKQVSGAYIVWRSRPSLQEGGAQFPDWDFGVYEYRPPVWKITWRCHVMKEASTQWVAALKPEGHPIPYTPTRHI
jgi:hypothetical protein